jgi:hypothetical protein
MIPKGHGLTRQVNLIPDWYQLSMQVYLLPRWYELNGQQLGKQADLPSELVHTSSAAG